MTRFNRMMILLMLCLFPNTNAYAVKTDDCVTTKKVSEHFLKLPATLADAITEVTKSPLKDTHALTLQPMSSQNRLTQAEIDTALVNLVRYTGFVPDLLGRKDVYEKGKLAIAFPLTFAGIGGYRLVIDYTITSGNTHDSAQTIRTAHLNKIFLVSPSNKKIAGFTSPLQTEVIIFGADATSKNTLSMATFNAKIMATLKKNIQTKEASIQKIAQRALYNRLLQINEENDDAFKPPMTREFTRFKAIADASAREQHPIPLLSDLMDNKEIRFATTIAGPLLERYVDFIASFHFNPSRNQKPLRNQELLQQLKSTADLKRFQRRMQLTNFKNWVADRSLRQIGGIPIGIALGLVGMKLFQSDHDVSPQNSAKGKHTSHDDPTLYVDEGGHVHLSSTHQAQVITLKHKDKVFTFTIESTPDGGFGYIPDNQTDRLWKTAHIILETVTGIRIPFNVYTSDDKIYLIEAIQ